MKVYLTGMSQPIRNRTDVGVINPMAIVETAACMCYDSEPDLVNYRVAKGCAKSGHMSVYEHISFTFEIHEVSRALLAQLTRHRIASFSVHSQRYCDESDFEYVNPFAGKTDEGFFDFIMFQVNEGYTELLKDGAMQEDARAVLPNACHTSLVFTMNARALIESSHLRLCSRAQKEIRQLFQAMRDLVKEYCPEVAVWMVPSCEIHPTMPFCPEGKSCGRHPKLKDVYRNPVLKKLTEGGEGNCHDE